MQYFMVVDTLPTNIWYSGQYFRILAVSGTNEKIIISLTAINMIFHRASHWWQQVESILLVSQLLPANTIDDLDLLCSSY